MTRAHSSASRPRQAVILAGGRGTRLRPLTDTRPKPMIEFHGRPFLEYMIEMLRDQGFERILLLLGYMADSVVSHFGDGEQLGVEIDYAITAPDDLTGHRLRDAERKLDPVFLLAYCDNYWPMRFEPMWDRFASSEARAMVTVYANRDGYTRDNVRVSEDGIVTVYDPSRTRQGLEGVEIGYAIVRREALDLLPAGEDALFEKAVYPKLVEQGELLANVTGHRYYSVGSHERLPLTERFLARQPTVILDRDGVLNVRPPKAEYVTIPDEFEWMPDAREGLALFAAAGYRTIVVSNQAGIARGALTEQMLERIHARMRAQAEAGGGRVDAIFHCPHGWDDGCECRKPRPGMLFEAQRAFDLDLTRVTFVGDDERDGQAADAAGCRSVLMDDRSSLVEVAKRIIEAERAPQEAIMGGMSV